MSLMVHFPWSLVFSHLSTAEASSTPQKVSVPPSYRHFPRIPQPCSSCSVPSTGVSGFDLLFLQLSCCSPPSQSHTLRATGMWSTFLFWFLMSICDSSFISTWCQLSCLSIPLRFRLFAAGTFQEWLLSHQRSRIPFVFLG